MALLLDDVVLLLLPVDSLPVDCAALPVPCTDPVAVSRFRTDRKNSLPELPGRSDEAALRIPAVADDEGAAVYSLSVLLAEIRRSAGDGIPAGWALPLPAACKAPADCDKADEGGDPAGLLPALPGSAERPDFSFWPLQSLLPDEDEFSAWICESLPEQLIVFAAIQAVAAEVGAGGRPAVEAAELPAGSANGN